MNKPYFIYWKKIFPISFSFYEQSSYSLSLEQTSPFFPVELFFPFFQPLHYYYHLNNVTIPAVAVELFNALGGLVLTAQ